LSVQPDITAEVFSKTIAAFSICLVASLPRSGGNETLERLANELDDMASKAPDTPMAEILSATARNLIASEPT